MASPIADFVVSMGVVGRVHSQGSMAEAMSKDSILIAEIAEDKVLIQDAKEEVVEDIIPPSEAAKQGKLIVAEEVQEGHIGWKSFKLFLQSLGGDYPLLFWLAFAGGHFAIIVVDTLQIWWLGFWATQYELHSPSEVSVPL